MKNFKKLIEFKIYKISLFHNDVNKILYENLIDLQNNINYYFIDFNHIFSEISNIFPKSISNNQIIEL